jgi:hypothetical protein
VPTEQNFRQWRLCGRSQLAVDELGKILDSRWLEDHCEPFRFGVQYLQIELLAMAARYFGRDRGSSRHKPRNCIWHNRPTHNPSMTMPPCQTTLSSRVPLLTRGWQ